MRSTDGEGGWVDGLFGVTAFGFDVFLLFDFFDGESSIGVVFFGGVSGDASTDLSPWLNERVRRFFVEDWVAVSARVSFFGVDDLVRGPMLIATVTINEGEFWYLKMEFRGRYVSLTSLDHATQWKMDRRIFLFFLGGQPRAKRSGGLTDVQSRSWLA